jgi:SAM-dependent methyltransferase
MIELSDIAPNLLQNDEGLWVARGQTGVSYPTQGDDMCVAVEDNSFWFNHRNNIIVRLLKAFPPAGAVFDVGGGNGFVCMALERAGIETVVVEPGPHSALNAMKRGLPVVIRSALEDVGFKAESVAAFGLFDVLEHIEGDREFLQTLHRSLVQSGWLYLTVPAHKALWSIDDDLAGHFRRYTTRVLTKHLTEAGFTVRYCSYFFSFLAPAIFAFRSIPSRLRLRRSVSAATTEREHASPSGLGGWLLAQCLALERKRVEQGKRIPLGSSCIAVAQKCRY